MSWLKRALGFVLSAYLALAGILFALQRSIIYHPTPDPAPPAQAGYPASTQVVHYTSADGLALKGWYIPPRAGAPVIVHFHGNAGTLADRPELAQALVQAGYGALFVTYRGYAGLAGRPNEQGLYQDARAALDWLAGRGNPPIILWGYSLGSGVAVQMASERADALALVLEAPFTSIMDMARLSYPFLPADLLVRDRFDNLSKIQKVRLPLFVLHGGRDTVVPQRMGRALYEAAPGVKAGYWPELADHGNPLDEIGWQHLQAFLQNNRRAP